MTILFSDSLFLFSCRFYAIIVVRITDAFNVENPPDQREFEDARAYDPQASPAQLYYITAAWDDPDRVPSSFIVGNGSTTVVDGTTYENTNLRSDTSYAVLFRIDIQSDTDMVRYLPF